MQTDLLRLERVLDRTALSRSALYRRVIEGTFPRPLKLRGGNIRAWVSTDINSWIANQIKGDDE